LAREPVEIGKPVPRATGAKGGLGRCISSEEDVTYLGAYLEGSGPDGRTKPGEYVVGGFM